MQQKNKKKDWYRWKVPLLVTMKQKKKTIGVILLVCTLLSLSSCAAPSAFETKQQLTEEASIEQETNAGYQTEIEESQETKVLPETVKIDGDSLRYLVADILLENADKTLYEKDLMGWVGKMKSYELAIESGEDMEFVRKYFDCSSVSDITVYDNGHWNEEQYQMLANFTGLKKLSIEAKGKIISLEAVEKLTQLEELVMDVKDVTVFEQFEWSDQVKTVALHLGQTGTYQELLKSLADSSITKLQIYLEKEGEFILNDIADCSSLEVLEVDNGTLRINNSITAGQLTKLKEMTFTADRQTDLSFIKKLPSLEYVGIAITERLDVAPLFERKNLELFLSLAQELAEFDDERYPKGQVIDVDLESYTNLEEVAMKPEEYLAAYQQYSDEEKRIECFVLRTGVREDEINNTEPVIIVSGEKIHQILDKDGNMQEFGYGSYRTDQVTLQDINFDNKNDIIMNKGHYGNQAALYYDAWCWNDKLQEYVYLPSYSEIMNPYVDDQNYCIRSVWRNWAASHSWAKYEYVDGQLLMTAEMMESEVLTEEYPENVPDGAEIWEWEEMKLIDDNWQQTEYFTVIMIPGEEAVYPEAYYRLEKEYLIPRW